MLLKSGNACYATEDCMPSNVVWKAWFNLLRLVINSTTLTEDDIKNMTIGMTKDEKKIFGTLIMDMYEAIYYIHNENTFKIIETEGIKYEKQA